MSTKQIWQIVEGAHTRTVTRKAARDFLKANPTFGYAWEHFPVTYGDIRRSVCTISIKGKGKED